MKKVKQMLALLLALALCLSLLAACSSSRTTGDSGAAGSGEAADNGAAGGTEPAGPEEQEEPEDLIPVDFILLSLATMDADTVQTVEDAMNAIVEPEIGVQVNLTVSDMGSYLQQVPMSIAGGEPIDIICAFVAAPMDFGTLYANGQLMDISGYLESDGQELLELCGTYLDAFRVNGGIYGIPCYRNYATSIWTTMRTDILEELGLLDTANAMDSFSDFEAILEAVANENRDNFYAMGGTNSVIYSGGVLWHDDSWADSTLIDNLSDGLGLLYAPDDGSGKVDSIINTPDFVWMAEKTNEWYDKGWVYPELAITTDTSTMLTAQNLTFAAISSGECNMASSETSATGMDMTAVKICDTMVMTSSVTKFAVGVPVTADEPEAAVRFLNLLYTNADLMNLINWGIEDRDYVLDASGVAGYPNGDANVPYHNADFVAGNFFLTAPWAGTGADFRDVARQALEEAPISPYLGFVLDTSELSTTIAALTSVKSEYWNSLICGSYSEEQYNAMCDAMEAAGLNDYIAEVQRQLDAFLKG